jgi:hypothetical protein
VTLLAPAEKVDMWEDPYEEREFLGAVTSLGAGDARECASRLRKRSF